MVLLTALGVGGATVFGALLGFAFKKISHKFSDIVLAFAAGVMLSAAVIGLILPSVTSVFYIYLLKENFAQIPDELYYAAKVDGTSDMKYLLKVMVPICKPTIITITILKVIECWNSYVWPRLITDDPNFFLVSNGIQEIRENGFGRENIPAMMAAVVVISVPLVVLFLIFRKKIMAGVARGGTKG
jgi:multiple sugar transport system permease protein